MRSHEGARKPREAIQGHRLGLIVAFEIAEDLGARTIGCANLGAAVTPPQTGAWQNGVYRRDFENGIALVNPKGNGAQTVTLETAFVKLSGTQAPSINNGATVTQVTLADRDGIILLRKLPAHQPKPPTGISAAN